MYRFFCALWIVSCVLVSSLAPVACAEESTIRYAGSSIGYGDGTDFLLLNRGNPMAQTFRQTRVKAASTFSNEFLLHPNSNITISLDTGNLDQRKDAVVYILDCGKAVAILNLHDTHAGSVQLRTGGTVFNADPGQIIVISKSGQFPEPLAHLPYRNFRQCKSDDFATIWSADYSAVCAISQLQLLRRLQRSHQSDTMFDQIFKTQAACSMLTAHRGNYAPLKCLTAATSDATTDRCK